MQRTSSSGPSRGSHGISYTFPELRPQFYSNESILPPGLPAPPSDTPHGRISTFVDHELEFLACRWMESAASLIAQEAEAGSRRLRQSCSTRPSMIRLSTSEADSQHEDVRGLSSWQVKPRPCEYLFLNCPSRHVKAYTSTLYGEFINFLIFWCCHRLRV